MANLIKHSKYKNTGILFELLVKQVTSDTLNGLDSPALKIIKNYFTKSELSKELKLYEVLNKSKKLNETKANILIQTIIESSKKLNRSSLRKQKYNLINEIKNHYNINDFFQIKLKNYKQYAALYTLMEAENIDNINTKQIVENKFTLLESLTQSPIKENTKDYLLEEFSNNSKDVRLLTYKILLEKFNSKYDSLLESQKRVLREYVTSVDSTPKLKEFYNQNINEIQNLIKNHIKLTDDTVIKIKLKEILNFIKPLNKNESIKNDNMIDLLQYYQLIHELNIANEKN
jgi:hypothetical protein